MSEGKRDKRERNERRALDETSNARSSSFVLRAWMSRVKDVDLSRSCIGPLAQLEGAGIFRQEREEKGKSREDVVDESTRCPFFSLVARFS